MGNLQSSKLALRGLLLIALIAAGFFLFNYIQRSLAFAEVWKNHDGAEPAAVYLASCKLTPSEINMLIEMFPKCSTTEASDRIGQLIDRSTPADWRKSETAAMVADTLVTQIENLGQTIATTMDNAQLDEEAFAREHNGISPNEADRSMARAEAAWTLERNGITPSRTAALVNGLGYVGATSPKAIECLQAQVSSKHTEIRQAAENALQRLAILTTSP
jgi:hypothetical protein